MTLFKDHRNLFTPPRTRFVPDRKVTNRSSLRRRLHRRRLLRLELEPQHAN